MFLKNYWGDMETALMSDWNGRRNEEGRLLPAICQREEKERKRKIRKKVEGGEGGREEEEVRKRNHLC